MSKAKHQVIDRSNIGIYADFGSESEDEHECDRQAIEKEDEDIIDFVKCHPIPSPDDEEGEYWWFKVFDRLKNDQGINGMIFFFAYEIWHYKKNVWKPH